MDFMTLANSLLNNWGPIGALIGAGVLFFKFKEQIHDISESVKDFTIKWVSLERIINELVVLANHVKGTITALSDKIMLQDKKLDKVIGQHELIIENLKDHIKANADYEGQSRIILSELNNKIIDQDKKIDRIANQHATIMDSLRAHIKDNADNDKAISSEIAVIKDRLG